MTLIYDDKVKYEQLNMDILLALILSTNFLILQNTLYAVGSLAW